MTKGIDKEEAPLKGPQNLNETPNIFEKLSKDATAELNEQEDKRLLDIIETEAQRPGDGHGGPGHSLEMIIGVVPKHVQSYNG